MQELSKVKGFYRVTMDELAKEAGVSKRTLYRYFQGKDEIVEATLEKFMTEVAQKMEEMISTQDKPENIFSNMLVILHYVGNYLGNPVILADLRRHYPHYWKKIDEFRLRKGQEIIISRLFLDEENKKYIRDIDLRIVTTAIIAAIQAVANPEFIIRNNLTFEETIRQLLEFFQHGFLKENLDIDK